MIRRPRSAFARAHVYTAANAYDLAVATATCDAARHCSTRSSASRCARPTRRSSCPKGIVIDLMQSGMGVGNTVPFNNSAIHRDAWPTWTRPPAGAVDPIITFTPNGAVGTWSPTIDPAPDRVDLPAAGPARTGARRGICQAAQAAHARGQEHSTTRTVPRPRTRTCRTSGSRSAIRPGW